MEALWLVVFGAALLLVRVGQMLYLAGLSRSKNAAGMAVRSMWDLCVAVLAFVLVGGAILLQTSNGFLAVRADLLAGWGGVTPSMFFHGALVLLATGLLAGALAERSRFVVVAAASALLAGVIIPVCGRWAWGGWLARMGYVDIAGAGPLHLAAGACALIGAIFVGPRTGKYNRDGSANMIPGHNVPVAGAGALTVLAAFLPYVIGCTLAHAPGAWPDRLAPAAMNVLLAAAAGCASAMLTGRLRYGKADVGLALSGLLGGLISITAAAGLVGAPAALVTGAVAGLLVPAAAIALDLLARIDDPTGGASVQLAGGAWGLVAAALFLPADTFGHRLGRLGVHVLGIAVITAFSAALSAGLFAGLRATVGIRSKEADEYDGLDLAEHDIGAYPDFQQTMIKSYHLREA